MLGLAASRKNIAVMIKAINYSFYPDRRYAWYNRDIRQSKILNHNLDGRPQCQLAIKPLPSEEYYHFKPSDYIIW